MAGPAFGEGHGQCHPLFPEPSNPKLDFLEILSLEEQPLRTRVMAAVDEMLMDPDSLGGVKEHRIGELRQYFVKLMEMQLEGCRKYIQEFDLENSEVPLDQGFVKHTQALGEKVAKLTAP